MAFVCRSLDASTGSASAKTGDGADWNDVIFLCPGELKAAAVLSAGFRATAVTGGEGWIPPPGVLSSLAGLRVCVLYDDDPPRRKPNKEIEQTGHWWGHQMVLALREVGAVWVSAKCGGRKTK